MVCEDRRKLVGDGLALMTFYVNSPCDDRHELQNSSQTNLNTTGSHHGDLIFKIGDQNNSLQWRSIGVYAVLGNIPLSPGDPAIANYIQNPVCSLRWDFMHAWINEALSCQALLFVVHGRSKNMESIFNNRPPAQCKLANPLFTAIFACSAAWVDSSFKR